MSGLDEERYSICSMHHGKILRFERHVNPDSSLSDACDYCVRMHAYRSRRSKKLKKIREEEEDNNRKRALSEEEAEQYGRDYLQMLPSDDDIAFISRKSKDEEKD